MAVVNNLGSCLKISYVIFAFCSAFFLGALKGFNLSWFCLQALFCSASMIDLIDNGFSYTCRFDRWSNCWININSRKRWSDSWFVPCTCYLDSLHCCKVYIQLYFSYSPAKFVSQWEYFHKQMVFFVFFFLNFRTNRFDIPLKLAILVALPALFGIWLGLSIAISVLVGVGYGFFTPWISAFEAFRQDTESNKFFHCLVVL